MPIVPVAQNLQPIWHPTCELTQIVVRGFLALPFPPGTWR